MKKNSNPNATLKADCKSLFHDFLLSLDEKEKLSMDCLLSFKKDRFFDLKSKSENEILTPNEVVTFNIIKKEHCLSFGKSPPHLVTVVKATRRCNLRCSYCHAWRDDSDGDMSFKTLCLTISNSLKGKSTRSVEFVWHGGEVTLLKKSFFEKVVWIQQNLKRNNQIISNSIQTNAVRVKDDLFSFFKLYDFSVGISIDGPEEIQDLHRLTRSGKTTYEMVRRGIQKIRSMGINYGGLVVASNHTVALGPRGLLEELIGLGFKNVGLLNLVPENGKELKAKDGMMILWTDYINFLTDLFDLWNEEYKERIVIREFVHLMAGVQGGQNGLCYFSGDCMGRFITVEPNGDVSACDKYVADKSYNFGSLKENNLTEILDKSENLKKAIVLAKTNQSEVKECKWFHVCKGGCPHDERLKKITKQISINECCGYKTLLDRIEKTIQK